MFPIANPAQITTDSSKQTKATDAIPGTFRAREIKESECFLTSVKSLRQNLIKGKHKRILSSSVFCNSRANISTDLSEILEKHIFVGIVDLPRSLSLVQYSTKLYLVNHGSLAYVCLFPLAGSFLTPYRSEELFYQLGLRQFGDLSRMKLEPPPPLRTLIEIAVNAERSTEDSQLGKGQIVDVSYKNFSPGVFSPT
jgi:DNA mismatch repair protein MLH1